MRYLILQIWMFLLAAGVIGLIAGWLLRGTSRKKMDALNRDWSHRLANVEAERDDNARRMEEMNLASARQGEMYLKLSEERDVMSKRLREYQNHSSVNDKKYVSKIRELQLELEEAKQELATLRKNPPVAAAGINSLTPPPLKGQVDSMKAELSSRDSTIETLHAKLAASLGDSHDLREKLQRDLQTEQEKSRKTSADLEETRRRVGEYEEQLRVSENKLSDVTKDLHNKHEQLTQTSQKLTAISQAAEQETEKERSLRGKLEASGRELEQLRGSDQLTQNKYLALQQELKDNREKLTDTRNQLNVARGELEANRNRISSLQDGQGASGSSASSGRTAAITAATGAVAAGAMASVGRAFGGERNANDPVDTGSDGRVSDGRTGAWKNNTEAVATASAQSPLMNAVDGEYRIEAIRSIGNDNRRHLHDMGVITTADLLERCDDDEGIGLIAKALGREPWVVSSWVAVADLLRVKGVDSPVAEVLELAGVYSVRGLADANPQRLLESVQSVNRKVGKLEQMPTSDDVVQWIQHATALVKLDMLS